jgi:hypothetical protein
MMYAAIARCKMAPASRRYQTLNFYRPAIDAVFQNIKFLMVKFGCQEPAR